MRDIGFFVIMAVVASMLTRRCQAQNSLGAPITNFHFQLTTVTQHKFDMAAAYTGANSLTTDDETQTTLTATIFLGVRLWRNASVFVNPEIAGGSGISGAHGIAGFTNGEAFRVGDPAPALYAARAFVRQIFNLSGENETVTDGLISFHPQDQIDTSNSYWANLALPIFSTTTHTVTIRGHSFLTGHS